MKRFGNIKDIDITCGDATSDALGSALVGRIPGATYTKFSDGHGRLTVESFNVDFSNNFNIKGVDKELLQFGITRPKSIEKEAYSRDFTCNSMLMPLDLSRIYDITNRGLKDIQAKTIDTCLNPAITLGSDPRRIARVIYLGAKLGFKPSQRVEEWIKTNKKLLGYVEKQYMSEKINKAMQADPKLAFELINGLGLNEYVPNSAAYRDFVVNDPEALYRSLNG